MNNTNVYNRNITATLSLAEVPHKLDEQNYPRIIGYTGKDQNPVPEYIVRMRMLNRSFITQYGTLPQLLDQVIDKNNAFCPARFKGGSAKGRGIPTSTDFRVKKKNKGGVDYIETYPKDLVYYNPNLPKESHITRNKENFEAAELIVIDVDEGYNSEKEVQNKIDEWGLDVNFIYSTSSHDPSRGKIKLRVGWILPSPVTDINQYERYISILTTALAADKQCIEASRFYFPGKNLIYVNYDYLIDFKDIEELGGGKLQKIATLLIIIL